jgi:hypothetical protein
MRQKSRAHSKPFSPHRRNVPPGVRCTSSSAASLVPCTFLVSACEVGFHPGWAYQLRVTNVHVTSGSGKANRRFLGTSECRLLRSMGQQDRSRWIKTSVRGSVLIGNGRCIKAHVRTIKERPSGLLSVSIQLVLQPSSTQISVF